MFVEPSFNDIVPTAVRPFRMKWEGDSVLYIAIFVMYSPLTVTAGEGHKNP